MITRPAYLHRQILRFLAPLALTPILLTAQDAAVTSKVGPSGQGAITIEARGIIPEPEPFFTAQADAAVSVTTSQVTQVIAVQIKILQGNPEVVSLGLRGNGEIRSIKSKSLSAWSVRRQGGKRFLDLKLHSPSEADLEKEPSAPRELSFEIQLSSDELELPVTHELAHLTAGDAAGFRSHVSIQFAADAEAQLQTINGFLPIETENEDTYRLQLTTGGRISLQIQRKGGSPPPAEFLNASLEGTILKEESSALFRLRGTAVVREADASLVLLRGNASLPDATLREGTDTAAITLTQEGSQSHYEIVFPQPGRFPIELEIAAAIATRAEWQGLDFEILPQTALLPIKLTGFSGEVEFRDTASVVPTREDENAPSWTGFLPASGLCNLAWKTARQAGEGKLFFNSTAIVEARVSAGLLRQDHHLDISILQGELGQLDLSVQGDSEVLSVEGDHLLGWTVGDATDDGSRNLAITLSRPIKGAYQLQVRTQSPLANLPAAVSGTRITPTEAVRHSGHLRVSNLGSVSLQPSATSGLIQLAPEQMPGNRPLTARQIFLYRFPSQDYSFAFTVEQIQPEINVSQQTVYRLAEADRIIQADLEFDIREAPVRETDLLIPADYSVVALTGAKLLDYVVATDVADGFRNVKIIFGEDVSGRQLIQLSLEKSEPAQAGTWTLPPLGFPGAESVRGDIGVAASPGFRLTISATDQLVEKPLAYFPKTLPDLQQAFRIREPGWSASLVIEPLTKSVQADVFHLYTLRDRTAFASVLFNYFITGAPVSEWEIQLPEDAANVAVDGKDVRTWRIEDQRLIATVQQPVMGPFTLLVTYEKKLPAEDGLIQPGQVIPLGVEAESGYLQVVSPVQLSAEVTEASAGLLQLDPLELPAEFQLLSSTPAHATYQYTERPFNLELDVDWYTPGTTIPQIIEFAEVASRVSTDGELVSDLTYFVKSHGQRNLRLRLPESTRLWSASVNNQSVSARRDGEVTLIPLPGGSDLNSPTEVGIRLGTPAFNPIRTQLSLPLVSAPVLKTEWTIQGDEGKVLLPAGGTVRPVNFTHPPSGISWILRHAIGHSFVLLLLAAAGLVLVKFKNAVRLAGILLMAIAVCYALGLAIWSFAERTTVSQPLRLSLPALTPEEPILLQVRNVAADSMQFSPLALGVMIIGLAVLGASWVADPGRRRALQAGGTVLAFLGLLAQPQGAFWFFLVLFFALTILLLPPTFQSLRNSWRRFQDWRANRRAAKNTLTEDPDTTPPSPGAATALLLLAGMILSGFFTSADAAKKAAPAILPGFKALDSVNQTVRLSEERLTATATLQLTGKAGDRFLLLRAPATLTDFQGEGLRLAKQNLPGNQTAYVLHPTGETSTRLSAKFSYQIDLAEAVTGFTLPTGIAASQLVQISYPKSGWRFSSPAQVRVTEEEGLESSSGATLVLAPRPHPEIVLKPRERDLSQEATKFYVEGDQLYLTAPGAVEGRHALEIRPSQGQVSELFLALPAGFTVSEVSGPVDSWQFDAGALSLQVTLSSPQSKSFSLQIETQRGLEPLPAEAAVSPILVPDAAGQVGLLALAFGSDAQPESITSDTLTTVNVSDFDRSLLPQKSQGLHQVFRYGQEGGAVSVSAVPVAPQIRAITQEVLSLGDERLVLSVNAEVEITRAGIFQLRFPLPEGLEVESLTGPALHHWSELEQDGQTSILLHLNGKTLGRQTFAITLAGPSPPASDAWTLPRVLLSDASRQTGQLVVRPAPGLRLRTVSRRNVSEIDPRTLGGQARNALAFRLLQQDWEVQLGIEQLDPWITGRALHEITLREGQTRSVIHCQFQVENASVRSLRFRLPASASSPETAKTVRATGKSISDLSQPEENDPTVWELQFKRRVLGEVEFRIEYERREDRQSGTESVAPAQFPDLRQLAYYHALRSGGRLDLSISQDPPQGWQLTDWTSVPAKLRHAGNRSAPAITLRAVDVAEPLPLQLQRHSLAEALKLRVSRGALTTVLSPLGDELTAVDLQLDVVQRSSLTVGLPDQASLFNIFVNGESVRAVRQNGAYQFYVLPGTDDRTATVRFVFSLSGDRPHRIRLTSPKLNVPLENIDWNVLLPQGFTLVDHDSNLELKRQEARRQAFNKDIYLSKTKGKREALARQAEQLLEQANDYIQQGEQQRARRALSSVTNQAGLDAASNEDARVQLENLQTQQAVVGLNTRRQRLYIGNDISQVPGSDQVEIAITENRILQEGDINFKPQDISQLLQGNSSEDNTVLQRIAARLVQHQKSTEPAPPAITATLPDEGTVYTFRRTVQVNENASLQLDLQLASAEAPPASRYLLLLMLLVAFAGVIYLLIKPKEAA